MSSVTSLNTPISDHRGMVLEVSTEDSLLPRFIAINSPWAKIRGFYSEFEDAKKYLAYPSNADPDAIVIQYDLLDAIGTVVGYAKKVTRSPSWMICDLRGRRISKTIGSLENVVSYFYANQLNSKAALLVEERVEDITSSGAPNLHIVLTFLPHGLEGCIIKLRLSRGATGPVKNRYIACDFGKSQIRGFYESHTQAIDSMYYSNPGTLGSKSADVFSIMRAGQVDTIGYLQRHSPESPWQLFNKEGDFQTAATCSDNGMREVQKILADFFLKTFPVTFADEKPELELPPAPLRDRRVRALKEMSECLKQWREGLLTDGELILALQCSEQQVEQLLNLNRLPYKAAVKLSLSDLDGD